jgi:hypothetical protein
MVGEYAGLRLRLSRDEFESLIALARQEMRDPQEQARFMLRQVLLVEADNAQKNANRGAMDSDPQRAAVARDFSCPSETTALCLRQGRQTETGPTTLRRKER